MECAGVNTTGMGSKMGLASAFLTPAKKAKEGPWLTFSPSITTPPSPPGQIVPFAPGNQERTILVNRKRTLEQDIRQLKEDRSRAQGNTNRWYKEQVPMNRALAAVELEALDFKAQLATLDGKMAKKKRSILEMDHSLAVKEAEVCFIRRQMRAAE